MKNWLGAALALVYFIFPMSIALFIMIFTPLMFPSEVSTIRTSGFAGPGVSSALIGVCGLIIGLSLIIPPLRRMYRALPWLYAFVKIFFANLILFNVAIAILNYGYEVSDEARHTLYFGVMIGWLIAGRLAMSLYFRWKRVV